MLREQINTHHHEIIWESDWIKLKRVHESQFEKQKIEDKIQRKKDREARRKAAELQKLREEMEAKFIETGTDVEFILG